MRNIQFPQKADEFANFVLDELRLEILQIEDADWDAFSRLINRSGEALWSSAGFNGYGYDPQVRTFCSELAIMLVELRRLFPTVSASSLFNFAQLAFEWADMKLVDENEDKIWERFEQTLKSDESLAELKSCLLASWECAVPV